MESIFDIFGINDGTKTPANTFHKPSFSNPMLLKDEGNNIRQRLKGDSCTVLPKKVLGDRGNKIQGPNKETKASREMVKKCSFLDNGLVNRDVKGTSESGSSSSFSKTHFEMKRKIISDVYIDNDKNKRENEELPEVEYHGNPLWDTDTYEDIWAEKERPTLKDLYNIANIWKVDSIPVNTECLENGWSLDFDNELGDITDIPLSPPRTIELEEVEVKFPWEL